MHYGIYLADVGQELVAQAFALAGPFYQAGNIHKLYGGGQHALRVHQACQHVQPLVGHVYLAHIGLYGAKAVVGCLRLGAIAYRVE